MLHLEINVYLVCDRDYGFDWKQQKLTDILVWTPSFFPHVSDEEKADI